MDHPHQHNLLMTKDEDRFSLSDLSLLLVTEVLNIAANSSKTASLVKMKLKEQKENVVIKKCSYLNSLPIKCLA